MFDNDTLNAAANAALSHHGAKEPEDFSYVTIYPFLGHVLVESRMRPEGRRMIGEGRSRHYDLEGKCTKDTGWEPTGVVMILPEPDAKRWWEFWK